MSDKTGGKNSDKALETLQQQALETARRELDKEREYAVELLRDEPDVWVFQVLPTERWRGGGAQILIAKPEGKVVDILRLQ
ncbi:MAG: hypothetical protein R3202_07805 [Candidatus Competibacterales bacterium]|nr:hypothetical protein [Candidatus Competibacterales bacterium]